MLDHKLSEDSKAFEEIRQQFECEIIDFVDERLVDEFTYSDWNNEIQVVEESMNRIIQLEIQQLSDKLEFQILKLEKKLDLFMEAKNKKRSLFSWWK